MPRDFQVGVRDLPPERGATRRAPVDQSFWTKGSKYRERNRSPWDPRNYPKPKPIVLPPPQFFEPDPQFMQPWEREVWRRQREGKQWTSRAKSVAGNVFKRSFEAIKLADTLGYYLPGGAGGVAIPDVQFEGYRRCDGPYGPIDPYLPPNGMWYAPGSLHCGDENFQLTGQAFGSGGFATLVDVNAAAGGQVNMALFGHAGSRPGQFMMGWTREDGAHWIEQSSWIREGPADVPFYGLVTIVSGAAIDNELDPNIARDLLSLPSPLVAPVFAPSVAPALVPLVTPWGPAPELEVSPLVQAEVATWPAYQSFATPLNQTVSAPAVGSGPMVNVPVTPIAPPTAGVKERKTINKSRALAVAVYKVLDAASEYADIVDAVYQALPEDVRKRWDRPDRRAVDAYGQYGVNGADWKLQALWHNWHRLDTGQAVVNIAKNQLEDAAYGAIHKYVPPQAGGPAMSDAWRAFGKGLKQLGL